MKIKTQQKCMHLEQKNIEYSFEILNMTMKVPYNYKQNNYENNCLQRKSDESEANTPLTTKVPRNMYTIPNY